MAERMLSDSSSDSNLVVDKIWDVDDLELGNLIDSWRDSTVLYPPPKGRFYTAMCTILLQGFNSPC